MLLRFELLFCRQALECLNNVDLSPSMLIAPLFSGRCPDLAFYPVGIVVGRREDGKLLVCHCSSGQNNVVVTEFAASGFTDLGRPDIF